MGIEPCDAHVCIYVFRSRMSNCTTGLSLLMCEHNGTRFSDPPLAMADESLRFHPLAFVHGSRLNDVRWVKVPRNKIHVYEKGKRKVHESWFIVTSVQSSGPCP